MKITIDTVNDSSKVIEKAMELLAVISKEKSEPCEIVPKNSSSLENLDSFQKELGVSNDTKKVENDFSNSFLQSLVPKSNQTLPVANDPVSEPVTKSLESLPKEQQPINNNLMMSLFAEDSFNDKTENLKEDILTDKEEEEDIDKEVLTNDSSKLEDKGVEETVEQDTPSVPLKKPVGTPPDFSSFLSLLNNKKEEKKDENSLVELF